MSKRRTSSVRSQEAANASNSASVRVRAAASAAPGKQGSVVHAASAAAIQNRVVFIMGKNIFGIGWVNQWFRQAKAFGLMEQR
jgi:hypothetical protein